MSNAHNKMNTSTVQSLYNTMHYNMDLEKTWSGAQWLSGRVLDLRSRGCGFEPQ